MQAGFRLIAACAAFAVPAIVDASRAVDAADARAGRAFAVENCSRCHAVDRSGASPIAGAPPFRLLGLRYKIEELEEALAEGIVTGHGGMPEFTLNPRQIDDLLAHLRRIASRR